MNTTALLERARQIGSLPTETENWDDAAMLAEATEALRTKFAQAIITSGSGYWRHQEVISTTIGKNEYRINPRATAQSLQKFEVSSDGGQTWSLMRILTLGSDGLYESTVRGTPQHYTHYGDYVRVFPTPANSTTKFRFTFYLSPSTLIAPPAANLGRVVTVAGQIVVVEGDMTGMIDGAVDFVNTDGCNEVSIFDAPCAAALSVGDTQLTFPSTVDLTRVVAGQVARVPDTTDQVPLPRELHNCLATYLAASVLLDLGDATQGDKLAAKAAGDLMRVLDIAIPRDKAHPVKIKPRNSWLRRNAGVRWR